MTIMGMLDRVGLAQGTAEFSTAMAMIGIDLATVFVAFVNAVAWEYPFFNLSSDISLSGVVSALTFGAACIYAFRVWRRRSGQTEWLVICLVAGLLAVETVVGIHDRLEHIPGLGKVLFVVYPVAGLVVLAWLVRPIRKTGPPTSLLLVMAGAVLVVSQVAGAVTSLDSTLWLPAFDFFVMIEEGGEMVSASLLLAAVVGSLTRAPGGLGGAPPVVLPLRATSGSG